MSVSQFLQSTAQDVQTTVTSLGAAIAGVAADRVSDYLISSVGGSKRGIGLGNVGLNFVARSAVVSVAYAGVSMVMPQTSQNVFFTIVFFASNESLVTDARSIAQMLLGSIGWNPDIRLMSPPGKQSRSPGAAAGCACAQ